MYILCYVQIIREFNRIMGINIAVEIVEKWQNMVQQIPQLGRMEADNKWIQDLLKDVPEELSDGGYRTHKYLMYNEYIN